MTASAKFVEVGIAAGAEYAPANVEQLVIPLVLTDHELRVGVGRSVGVVDDDALRERFAEGESGAQSVDADAVRAGVA
jgi:hypothetical protein